MSEQELIRFTPRLLTAHQISLLLALVEAWHDIHVEMVGPDQLGVIGPTQRHALVIHQGNGVGS